ATGFELAVRMTKEPSADERATRLLNERLVPVYSPAYLRGIAGPGGRADLSRATLLHVTTVAEDWAAWLRSASLGAAPGTGLRFDEIHLAFGAAAAGLGVAIGGRPLVDPELESGLLVAADDRAIESATSYWLIGPGAAPERPAAAAFRRWLTDEMSR